MKGSRGSGVQYHNNRDPIPYKYIEYYKYKQCIDLDLFTINTMHYTGLFVGGTLLALLINGQASVNVYGRGNRLMLLMGSLLWHCSLGHFGCCLGGMACIYGWIYIEIVSNKFISRQVCSITWFNIE